jgi:colanic acid/amylovoran biosynthesis protein
MNSDDRTRFSVSIAGACPWNLNMGVRALFASAVAGVHRRLPESKMVVFHSGLGHFEKAVAVDGGEPVQIQFEGYRTGRRYYRSENLRNLQVCSRLGGFGRRLNTSLAAISQSSAVLDVSGGDSFTDMYSDDRINSICGLKELAISVGTPLILLPQTYGPFGKSRERAAKIVRAASYCWARDERSFENLKDLLGEEFDNSRHLCGVDMAFGLEARRPSPSKLGDEINHVLANRSNATIGLNVSGLLTTPTQAYLEAKYGFKANYRECMSRFVDWCLADTDATLVLVPHVMGGLGPVGPKSESDLSGCVQIREDLLEAHKKRVVIAPVTLDQGEVKWLISQMDWFCGTRMHATIASLSSGVPTATVAYSDKALGVFESCGQGKEVFDPRKLDLDSVVGGMIDSFKRRKEIRPGLQDRVADVKNMANYQMDSIAKAIKELANDERGHDK